MQLMKILTVVLGLVALFYLYNEYVVKKQEEPCEDQVEQFSSEDIKELEEQRTKAPLTSEDLLPQDKNNQWAKANPEGKGSIAFKNFLEAGHHIGVNTVGQSLRNANLQIRSEPPNPRLVVSPWRNTTVEYDTNRKPLEIGGDCGEA